MITFAHTKSPTSGSHQLLSISELDFCFNMTHINEIIWYFSFSVWFVSLSIMPLSSIHVVETGKIFFFFMGGYKSILHFLYPFISEDLHCLTHIYCYKILKGNTVKVLQSIRQQIWKIHQWPQDWRRSVFISISKKANANEWSTTSQLCSFHMLARLYSKSFKLGFSSKWTENFRDVQAGFRKGRETRDQIANICWIME